MTRHYNSMIVTHRRIFFVEIFPLMLRFSNPNQAVRHFIDIVHNIPRGELDVDNLKGIFRDKAWGDLPSCMRMAGHPNFEYKSQYIFVTQNNGNVTLVKHFFLTKTKLTQLKLQKYAIGKLHEIMWGNGNKVVERKAFQWMLEQMGGLQSRHYALSGEKKRSASSAALGGGVAEEDQDAGWDFIIQHGERDKGELKQLRWIHKNINREGSPIKGWSEKLVQRALDSLANDGCLAKLATRYDLVVTDFHPLFLDLIFKDAVPHLLDHSLWLLGEPGVGKTPLARATAMMFSRYYGGSGQFRTSSDFNFFRGIFFNTATPAIYDDGDISGEAVKKKKAFADVGDNEGILKERWNAAKFLKNQLRIVVDNAYSPLG